MNTEHELFGELHEQEENGLFGNEHRRQHEVQQESFNTYKPKPMKDKLAIKKARSHQFWLGGVMRRFFCGHLKWVKTGNTMGCLYEHKCNRCGKKIYRRLLEPPISHVD